MACSGTALLLLLFYAIHAQTVGHLASPLPFPSFSHLTVTFPKLSVILPPLRFLVRFTSVVAPPRSGPVHPED
jgi:hypothetical protein